MMVTITIPDGLPFSVLGLTRDAGSGDIGFNWPTIEQICAASGLDPSVVRETSEDNIAALIVHWYRAARAGGEPADPVAELLIAEIEAEDAFGESRVQRGSPRAQ